MATQRHAQDHRPEEAHLQAGPGRVHRAGQDRNGVHAQSVRAPSVRARRISQVLRGGRGGARCGRHQVLGHREQHPRDPVGSVQQLPRQAAHPRGHVVVG